MPAVPLAGLFTDHPVMTPNQPEMKCFLHLGHGLHDDLRSVAGGMFARTLSKTKSISAFLTLGVKGMSDLWSVHTSLFLVHQVDLHLECPLLGR